MNNNEAIQFLKNICAEKAACTIGKEGFYVDLMQYHIEAIHKAIKALENEPKKGKWIKILPEKRGYTEFYRCSNCLCNVHIGYYSKNCDYDYCPYCGAAMEEGTEKC